MVVGRVATIRKLVLARVPFGAEERSDVQLPARISGIRLLCYDKPMDSQYPYQIVYFLDKEPEIGETVYSGPNGWYPQLALKRRFKFSNMDEKAGLIYIEEYCRQSTPDLKIRTGELTADDRMPVKYIQIDDSDDKISFFHRRFIAFMGERIESRYPEREGSNYLPHVTAEYNGEMVIHADKITNKEFSVQKICVLKDVAGGNSVAYKYYLLGEI